MYAILKNNQLVTQGHDGAEFVVDVDGPGIYEVKTCRERDGVVEFGTGLVTVTVEDGGIADALGTWGLPIDDHKVEILTPAKSADYAQK